MRTQVCFPNIKLLIDKISIVTLPDVQDLSKNEAFRLLLTDGEKTIQGTRHLSTILKSSLICVSALMKRRSYKSVLSGDVCEGSYILVKKFQLATAKRLTEEGFVMSVIFTNSKLKHI